MALTGHLRLLEQGRTLLGTKSVVSRVRVGGLLALTQPLIQSRHLRIQVRLQSSQSDHRPIVVTCAPSAALRVAACTFCVHALSPFALPPSLQAHLPQSSILSYPFVIMLYQRGLSFYLLKLADYCGYVGNEVLDQL